MKLKQPNSMCDFERYNIKVVEGNEFTLLLPLKSRTFVASRPVDEDIVIEDLENLRVLVNNTEYSSVRKESDGVAIDFPATLKQGDYDVVLTATYHGVNIRAAYNDAVIIVAWNQQSDAQQYIQGSPFILPAAYVIGVMTDPELEALKAKLRLEIAAAHRAKEEAEQAKDEYISKAEALDDVAQQSTLTQGVQDIREDNSHIDIDTSNLAKEVQVKNGNDTAISVSKEIRSEVGTGSDTAAESGTLFAVVKWVKDKVKSIFQLIGSPESGQPSTLFAAIAAGGGGAEFYHNPATEMSSATASLDPNIMYVWEEISALTITLNTPTNTSIVNEYMLCFYSGSTPTTLTFTNNNVQVVGNIEANRIVNVSVVYNSLTQSYSALIA